MITLTIILGIIYVVLLAELIFGWSSVQNKKFYKKLFKPKVYYLTLFFSVILLTKPLYDLYLLGHFTFFILAIPFVYLLLFKVINWISLQINQRNIIIVGRGDIWPKEHKWYVDSLLHLTATFLSIFIPMLISLYFDGYLHN
jgi:hypothetical protein